MKYNKIVCCLLVGSLITNKGFTQATVTAKEFKVAIGCWQGTLTYLDYSTNKPFSMSANLDIKQINNTNSFSFANFYPKEPNANSVDTVLLSADGKFIDDETVRSKQRQKDGSLKIITQKEGIDGNDHKKALFRFTYILGSNIYYHKKEVKFVNTTEWITRHEYKYVPCKK